MTRFALASQPVESLGTALERVRCRRPVLIERMMGSLSTHGQLTALVAVERKGALEVLEGFKRLAAAKRMGWPALTVSATELDEAGQWATMLALNRGPQSMTELEEALVLRELAQTGLAQVQIAELVQRHKSWVSRRIGLVERLHPELVEAMKLGLLAPGVARRLLSLPPGNQLQIAATAQSAGLGPRDTELLVSLWQRAKDPMVRQHLLAEPRAALAQAHPELVPLDPRLTPQGQQLSRLLRLVAGVAPRLTRLLPPAEADQRILSKQIAEARRAVSQLATSLGSAESAGSAGASEGAGATARSSGLGRKAGPSVPSRGSSASSRRRCGACCGPSQRRMARKPSLLDPFRPLIRKLVLEDELTAERVQEEIKATGYRGGYTILKEYVRTFRPKASRRPHDRFETDPGEQGQVDLSPYTVVLGVTPTKVVCFSMIFGFSRWQFVRFLLHADARSICHCHVLAFEEAGGVPHEILYHRMKQVVIASWKEGVLFHRPAPAQGHPPQALCPAGARGGVPRAQLEPARAGRAVPPPRQRRRGVREGLREVKGTAAGYHMSRILQLADKVGVLRVAEALRHAARYGAFDSHAVARIVSGRTRPGPRRPPPLSSWLSFSRGRAPSSAACRPTNGSARSPVPPPIPRRMSMASEEMDRLIAHLKRLGLARSAPPLARACRAAPARGARSP